MSIPESPQKTSFMERLQSVSRGTLFLTLMVVASVPLFLENLSVPNRPFAPTIDLFAKLMALEEGSTVLLESDWTLSTRGESGGQMEALLRILMRRKVKFALFSAADPQAPQVARDTIDTINKEREKAGEPRYEHWKDWLNLGYFPNAEATSNAIASDVRGFWGDRTAVNEQGHFQNVFQSPVLQNINQSGDAALYIFVTASNTSIVVIERVTGKIPVAGMVTGVMGPESTVYYTSGQLVGLSVGLKGVYDLETMMQYGVNLPGPDGKIAVPSPNHPEIPGFEGAQNFGKGKRYYPTLHGALALLILAVVVGNLGMIAARKRAAK